MINFTITETSRAGIDAVFKTMTDHRSMSEWTPLRKSTLDREGTPDPNGVGAVRRLSLVGPPMVEEITEYEAPHRFAYKMLSGLPVKDHVGRVELREANGGTEISYTVTSTPTIPGAAVVMKPILKKAIGDMVKGAAKAAERRT
jgi:uncharacterized protein YndB with AHSA1/START domain